MIELQHVRFLFIIFLFLFFWKPGVSQDSTYQLPFPTNASSHKISGLAYDSVQVKDVRSQSKVIANWATYSGGIISCRSDSALEYQINRFLDESLPGVKKVTKILEVEITEFRVFNNYGSTFRNASNHLRSNGRHFAFKLGCRLYLRSNGDSSQHREYVGTMNRFYRFSNVRLLPRTAVPAIKEALYAASDLAKTKNGKYHVHNKWLVYNNLISTVLGDNLQRRNSLTLNSNWDKTPPAIDSSEWAKHFLGSDSLDVFATYQDFLLGNFQRIAGELTYDSTWKTFRASKRTKFPGYSLPWGVRNQHGLYIDFFDRFFSELAVSDNIYSFQVPRTFPRLTILFGIVLSSHGHSSSTYGHGNILASAAAITVSSALEEASTKSVMRGQVKEAEKPDRDQAYSLDMLSGDVLYN